MSAVIGAEAAPRSPLHDDSGIKFDNAKAATAWQPELRALASPQQKQR